MSDTPDHGQNQAQDQDQTNIDDAVIERRKLAAQRALEEAEARRQQQQQTQALPKEVGARKGPEPTRYGDWEKKGIASDF